MRQLIKKSIVFLSIWLAVVNVSMAQNIDSISYLLDSVNAKSPFFGNIIIKRNDQIIFEKSYGYADADKKVKLTSENSFQVASISKQYTAYGIMILKHRGLLAYDSFVNKYLPIFPYKNITVRHLLTHTSGRENLSNYVPALFEYR
jgi:CubicO group peptidase (beta-lactamase class C family)